MEGLEGGDGRGRGAGKGDTPEARAAAGLDEKGHGPARQLQLAAAQMHRLDGAAALAVYSWLQCISPTQEADGTPIDPAVGALQRDAEGAGQVARDNERYYAATLYGPC